MVYIFKDRLIRVEWTIYKGISPVKEDFSRSNVKVFLLGNREKYLLQARADKGTLYVDIPSGLEEGTYSIEAIWVKNMDHVFDTRSVCRSKKEDLFSITKFEDEATNIGEGVVVLKVKTSTATYGYDGLSSYELAVLRGDWSGTEGEWLKHERYVSVLDSRGDSEVDTMSQKAITDELEKQDEAIEDIRNDTNDLGDRVEEAEDKVNNMGNIVDEIKSHAPVSARPAGFKPDIDLTPEITVDRAWRDHEGNVIRDTYITRRGLRNEIIDITNQQVTDLKPGSVDPDDLSEATKQLIGNKSITNLPDEEDITVTDNQTLKLKDKEYAPKDYSGMGRVYLRKHYVNGVNTLTQHMMRKPNTIYIIQYDYCLAGQTIEVPENCVLKFQGGSLRNGIVILNGTSLMEDGSRIFDNITLSGILNGDLSCTMFGASPSSSKDLNLDSIKETIKQLDNVGGGELLIPQEINYGYERNTPSTWVYTTVSNNIIVKDESKGNTYNLPSRDGSQIRNFFMTEGNPMDGKHDGGGFMVRANWHPYMMLSNDRDPVEANNRRATYFVGNNGKICWGIGQGSNTIEPDGTDRDDALSNFKIVGNDIAGGNGLTNMMVINKTNAFFGFNLSTPAQDYHFNFRNVEGRDNANVHFDASLRSGTLEILLTAGEAKKRIGVSPITNNLYFVSDNSIVTSITRNGDILLKGNLGLFTGEGDPNGVFSCGIGALYQNRTVRANGKGLYVCTDTANKKFNLVSGVDSCTSTSRPSTTELPVGFPTFDTTLGKPIWWTGTNWVDATGATV